MGDDRPDSGGLIEISKEPHSVDSDNAGGGDDNHGGDDDGGGGGYHGDHYHGKCTLYNLQHL